MLSCVGKDQRMEKLGKKDVLVRSNKLAAKGHSLNES